MIARLAGKALWGTTKATVKYVVVPIAYTAALAYMMEKAADQIREHTPDPNGHSGPVEPHIRPAP